MTDIVERTKVARAIFNSCLQQAGRQVLWTDETEADGWPEPAKRAEAMIAADAAIEAMGITALRARVGELEGALTEMGGIVEHAQQIVGATLPPDGMSHADAIGELLLLLDGPDQRRIQGLARSILSRTEDKT